MKENSRICLRTFIAALLLVSVVNVNAARAAQPDAAYATDPKTHRLCAEAADPDGPHDKTHINCSMELGFFSDNPPPPEKDSFIVTAYNVERGMKLEKQIELFRKHPVMKNTDVLLVSEADRGCSRTGYRNVARELAAALGMNYIYGVEFVELPRRTGDGVNKISTTCEHGNALMSRYPFAGIRQIRHREAADWYIPPAERTGGGQPRLGGRMALSADIVIAGRTIRFYSVHFESGLGDNDIRASQAAELIRDADAFGGPAVIGGDMNTSMYVLDLQGADGKDPTVKEFFAAGFTDAHNGLPLRKRGTTRNEYGIRAVIDLIFVRGLDVLNAGICPGKYCDPLSDHLPVYAEFKIVD